MVKTKKMKDTNQIEKALINKIDAELKEVTNDFNEALNKLQEKYGRTSFFYLRERSKQSSEKGRDITTKSQSELKTIIHRMLIEAYQRDMLRIKSNELIAKLDLI